MKLIPYTKALITKKDIMSVNTAMKKGWGKNHNLYIQMFEKNFKKKNENKICHSDFQLHRGYYDWFNVSRY